MLKYSMFVTMLCSLWNTIFWHGRCLNYGCGDALWQINFCFKVSE
uniref:Uncharacterized protein n=1 Tax=Arundo donax TaxID=35708 RepID=A0A0A9DN95_ARUDO